MGRSDGATHRLTAAANNHRWSAAVASELVTSGNIYYQLAICLRVQFPDTLPNYMTSQSLPPPFVIVEGVINARSVGGFSTSDTDADIVKPAILFRSADPSRITPKGKEQLLALGVHRVFDFRADDEIAGYKTTAPIIPGVEFLRAPVSESRAFDPVSLAARWVYPPIFLTYRYTHPMGPLGCQNLLGTN